MFGWKGKIVRIDLTRGSCKAEEMPTYLMQDYIGGRGMCTRILFDEIDPRIDALSPEKQAHFCHRPVDRQRCAGSEPASSFPPSPPSATAYRVPAAAATSALT